MRTFIVLLILSLITYSSSSVTGVAVDLKASQSVNTGSNVAFKITVTVSGDDASPANDKVTIKAIAGLLLVKSDDDNTKSTVTCTVSSPTEVVRGTPKDFDCTAQSLTTAATYKLAGDGSDFALTDNTDTKITTASVTGTVTMAVTAAAGGTTPTTGGNTTNTNTTGGDAATPTTGSGKFLAVSSLFTLLLFF